MAPSDRFKPIQKLNARKERKAAELLGDSLRARSAAEQRLNELRAYHAEYLERFNVAARAGIGAAQVREYLAFIAKLDMAIGEQERAVARSRSECDRSKDSWRGAHTKSRAMDKAVDRMRDGERAAGERNDQKATDDRNQRRK